jgi:hypothetical protein
MKTILLSSAAALILGFASPAFATNPVYNNNNSNHQGQGQIQHQGQHQSQTAYGGAGGRATANNSGNTQSLVNNAYGPLKTKGILRNTPDAYAPSIGAPNDEERPISLGGGIPGLGAAFGTTVTIEHRKLINLSHELRAAGYPAEANTLLTMIPEVREAFRVNGRLVEPGQAGVVLRRKY